MDNKVDGREVAVQLSGVRKMYKLGQIGSGTLRRDLQSWWAKIHGKEDPNSKIGEEQRSSGETFMALNGIDMTIYKGEAVGIIGRNGAGKSTLLKLLSRVTAPTEGEIDLYGRVASMLEVGTGFHGEMTGRENIYMNGAILGMSRAEIDAKMEDIIEFSEVREFIDTPVKRYSSGMYVKLAFSVAAHLDSEIMIMDEVLAVGDMAFQKKCLGKMRDVTTQEGRTVLYVSHNMNTIRQLCDRCIVLNQGKVVFEGDVEEAIAIYSGQQGSELPLIYPLRDEPRPSGGQHGKALLLTELKFLAKEQAVFKRTGQLHMAITIECHKDIAGLKMYVPIYASNGDLVGLSQTYKSIADVRGGQPYRFELSLDCSNLAEDVYSMELDLFSDDGSGRHWSVDHPLTRVFFKVVEDAPVGLEWNISHYGHVRLNELVVVSGESYEDG